MEPVIAKINGKKFHFQSKQDMARYILERVKASEKYAPLDNRIENLKKIYELIGYDRRAKFTGDIITEEVYVKAYWEAVLIMEYMGTLPGFSVWAPIEKGATNYNPEKRRMSENWTIYEEDD